MATKSQYNETLARLAIYNALGNSPEHGLSVLYNRLGVILNSRERRSMYRVLRFLDKNGIPLKDLAMLDVVGVVSPQYPCSIRLVTYDRHPNYEAKKEARERIEFTIQA